MSTITIIVLCYFAAWPLLIILAVLTNKYSTCDYVPLQDLITVCLFSWLAVIAAVWAISGYYLNKLRIAEQLEAKWRQLTTKDS